MGAVFEHIFIARREAPITCFRSDVGDMIEGINLVERLDSKQARCKSHGCRKRKLRNGTVFPVSGVDFTLKLEEDEDSDV